MEELLVGEHQRPDDSTPAPTPQHQHPNTPTPTRPPLLQACPIGGKCPQPQTSHGWRLILFLCLAVGSYLGVGIYLNKRAGIEGLELIPHWRYWQQLPGLVSDGARYAQSQAILATRALEAKLNAMSEAGPDGDIRESLAARTTDYSAQ